MKKIIIIISSIFFSHITYSSIESCTDLYIGKIIVTKDGLERFTLLEQATNANGSNWVNLAGWTKEDKKPILSLILAAKMATKKVTIQTESGCGISSSQTLDYIVLQSSQ